MKRQKQGQETVRKPDTLKPVYVESVRNTDIKQDRDENTNPFDNKDVRQLQLSPYRRQELFVAWTHEQSQEYVGQVCKVSIDTVRKYRRLDKWDARIALIHAGVAEKIDGMLAASIIVQLHEIMVLRQRAYLAAMKGDFENARQAYQSYVDLAKLEKDIKPAAAMEGAEDLLTRARRNYLLLKNKEGKHPLREIPAIVQGGAATEPEIDAPKQVADNLPLSDDSVDNKGDA